jgi:hypothetical protein
MAKKPAKKTPKKVTKASAGAVKGGATSTKKIIAI